MRPPAAIKQWLNAEEISQWLHNAPDENAYKRRLVIYLTHTNRICARKVAEKLGVSRQAVWLWISQYNKNGPKALDRRGRGGKRWGFLTADQEHKILKPFFEKVKAGQRIKPVTIKEAIEKQLNRKVSMPYVYKLLSRHNWSQTISHTVTSTKHIPKKYTAFQKLSRPWLRNPQP